MNYKKFHVKQHDEKDCGAASLSMILRFYGAYIPLYKIREEMKITSEGASIYGIIQSAGLHNLQAEAMKGDISELREALKQHEAAAPFIARVVSSEGFAHFVAVFAADDDKLTVGDPASEVKRISWEDFAKQYLGQIITFARTEKFVPVPAKNIISPRYINMLKKHKGEFARILFLSVLLAFMSLGIAVLFGYVIGDIITLDSNAEIIEEVQDEAHEEEHHIHTGIEKFIETVSSPFEHIFSHLQTAVTVILLSYFLQGFLELLRTRTLLHMSRKMNFNIMQDYYASLITMPESFTDSYNAGEILQRMNDTSFISDALSNIILIFFLDFLYIVLGGSVLFFINASMFISAIFVSCLYVIAVMYFRKPMRNINYEIMEADSNAIDYVKESIDSSEAVKGFTLGHSRTRKAGKLFAVYTDKSFRREFLANVQAIITSGIDAGGTILLLAFGALLHARGIITVSDVITFYFVFNYFSMPVRSLTGLQPMLHSALIAAERLDDIFEGTKEDYSGTETNITEASIEVKNLSFRYAYGEKILDDISFTIPAKTHTAIIGENGSGKSTIGKLLIRLHSPEEGSIKIGGISLEKYELSALRRQVLYISQNSYIFRDTLRGNLAMNNTDANDETILDAIGRCFTKKLADKFPNGLDTMLDGNGANLSSGECAMINAARALIARPKILITDEITGSLDSSAENRIMEIFRSMTDTTCIHITHHISITHDFDLIFTVKDGKITEQARKTL